MAGIQGKGNIVSFLELMIWWKMGILRFETEIQLCRQGGWAGGERMTMEVSGCNELIMAAVAGPAYFSSQASFFAVPVVTSGAEQLHPLWKVTPSSLYLNEVPSWCERRTLHLHHGRSRIKENQLSLLMHLRQLIGCRLCGILCTVLREYLCTSQLSIAMTTHLHSWDSRFQNLCSVGSEVKQESMAEATLHCLGGRETWRGQASSSFQGYTLPSSHSTWHSWARPLKHEPLSFTS